MAAPIGHPKWGGRQKGTPNKTVADLREAVEARLGMSVPEKLIKMGLELEEAGDKNGAVTAMGKAASYLYASLKAIEHSGEVATTPTLNIILDTDKLPAPQVPPNAFLDGDHG